MKRINKHLTHISVSLLFSAVSALALADFDAPDEVTIQRIDYAGSGCPAGSVAKNLAPDRKAFTLLFDSFIAEVGPGVGLRDMRKNCQLAVSLKFPSGWSFTIVEVDHRGYVALERNASAIQKASYYFQGDSHAASLQTNLRGPLEEDYHVRDTLAVEALVWSPCGLQRALNINTQILASSTRQSAHGIITVDSIDGTVEQKYGIQWKRCR